MPSIYKSIANKNSDKAKDKAKDNAKDNAKKAVKYEYAGKLYNSLAAQQAAKAKALAMKSGESSVGYAPHASPASHRMASSSASGRRPELSGDCTNCGD